MSSLNDLIASQDALLREAALALPHEFSQCTFTMGPTRQAVYLCLTCAVPRGICSSCSIACHADHEQVELFPKRQFRCDCPTSAIPRQCTLHRTPEDTNATNHYGQNFSGLFCRCARPYDPTTERETMIQCLACEDWFHESCLNLRERPPPRASSPNVPDPDSDHVVVHGDDDDCSDASSTSSELPSPLISVDDYESFVCAACVRNTPILRRYAGTKGIIMVVRDGEQGAWKKLENDVGETSRGSCEESSLDVTDSQTVATKRPRSASQEDEPEAKRSKVSGSTACLAPAVNETAQTILNNASASDNSIHQGTSDIFLTDGFRQRWCRCERCLSSLQAHPYLLEEEDTYEPPEDPDSGLSLEELGARALERLPRDRVIDGIHAFGDMRDHLLEYLRPFAQQGKVVEEADVTRFFEVFKEKRQQVN